MVEAERDRFITQKVRETQERDVMPTASRWSVFSRDNIIDIYRKLVLPRGGEGGMVVNRMEHKQSNNQQLKLMMNKSVRLWALSALLALSQGMVFAEDGGGTPQEGGQTPTGEVTKYDGLYDRPTYFEGFVQPTTWANNMVCVACVREGENGPRLKNYEVAVYDSKDELRCCKRSIAADDDRVTLTIVGEDGEEFHFKVVYGDVEKPTVVDVPERLTFRTNDLVGKDVPMNLTLPGRTYINEETWATLSDKENADVTVEVSYKAGEWNSLILPFAMAEAQVLSALGEGTVLGSLTGYTTQRDAMQNVTGITLQFDTVRTIVANTPYLVKVSKDVEGFSVDGVSITVSEDLTTRIGEETKRAWTREIGTYVSRQVPEDCFVLKGGKIVYSDGTLWQSAFTVYFDFYDIPATTSAGMSVSIGKDGMEVGKEGGNSIRRVRMASSDDTIYDLTGKIVREPLRRGMYIRGGKMIIIR